MYATPWCMYVCMYVCIPVHTHSSTPFIHIPLVYLTVSLYWALLRAASNFLIAIHCGCDTPLTCNHGQNFAVKLADFDSAMDIEKLQPSSSSLKQLYRNTPSGTPGYRPPEVSWLDCVNSAVEPLY